VVMLLLATPILLAAPKAPIPIPLAWPRDAANPKIHYLESISSPADASVRRGIFARFGDLLLGPGAGPTALLRPFAVAVDGGGRLLAVDQGVPVVHVVDSARNKHRVLRGPSRQPLESPAGVDADASGNIYVTDSAQGRLLLFDSDGRFLRYLGEARGESLFKRPTGVAVDRSSGLIYLTDSLRHKVTVLHSSGAVEREWGRRGEAPGEFNYPTAVALAADRVYVLDTMNFRVQVFTAAGDFLSSFGRAGNEPGCFFRPKGLAVDAKRNLVLVVDAMFEVVQAFTPEGTLVFAFGHPGSGPGEFRLPAGICISGDGRMLVADTYNGRIQVLGRK